MMQPAEMIQRMRGLRSRCPARSSSRWMLPVLLWVAAFSLAWCAGPAYAQSPDLRITAFSPPASGLPGDTLEVVNAVKNPGGARAGTFRVGFYLSADDLLSAGDTFIGFRTVDSLAAGAATSTRTRLILPASQAAGAYKIGMWIDDQNRVAESDEQNNQRLLPFTIPGQDAPDLLIRNLNAPATATIGEQIFISVTTKNQGQTASGDFDLAVYLSSDAVLSGDDLLLNTRTLDGLARGATTQSVLIAAIPSTLTPGAYFLHARVDDTDRVAEVNEANNGRQAPLVLLAAAPDLVVTQFGAPATAAAGQTFSVLTQVDNAGSAKAGSFILGVYLSADSLISASDRLLDIRSINSLLPGAADAAPMQITLPADLMPGRYYLGAWVDNFHSVAENDENNNMLVRRFDLVAKAELAVYALNAPATASPGQAFSVANTVINQGSADAGVFRVGFYLSADAQVTRKDAFLGARTIGTLGAGQRSTATTQLHLPDTLELGQYTLGMLVDDLAAIDEAVESNNSRETPLEIVPPPPVDLQLWSLQAAGSAHVGESISIDIQIKNEGEATAPDFAVGFYLSADQNVTVADLLLGTETISGFPAGAVENRTYRVYIPATVTPGNYQLAAWIDHLNAIQEPVETNNIQMRPLSLTGRPDLEVADFTFPAGLSPGQSASVQLTLLYYGSAAAAAFQTGIYLSNDDVITSADVLLSALDTAGLPAGASQQREIEILLPASLEPGAYFLGAWADHLAAQPELDEFNNTLVRALNLIGKPDLQPANLDAPAAIQAGQTVSLANAVKNTGTADAGAFTVRFYLSDDRTIDAADVSLGARTITALAVNATSALATPVRIDTATAPGAYFIGMQIDPQNVVDEANESNNVAIDSVLVLGNVDLTVSRLEAPTALQPGQEFTLPVTLQNRGSGAAGAFQITAYLSADALISAEDAILATRRVPGVAAQAELPVELPAKMPLISEPGMYYVLVWVDAEEVLPEIDEQNNIALHSVQVLGLPDLQPLLLETPAIAPLEQNFEIVVAVQNAGSADAAASRLELYLMPGPAPASDDLLLATYAVDALGRGRTDTLRIAVRIPGQISTGNYFFSLRTDAANAVHEIDEENNAATAAVAVGGQSDLRVSFTGAPDEVKPGETLALTVTLANAGSIAANNFATGIYLSPDNRIAASDLLLDSFSIGNLAAGASDSVARTLDLPPMIMPGKYYLIVFVDHRDAVSESDEANNRAMKSLTVGELGKPDLLITTLETPLSASPGQELRLRMITKNQAVGIASASITGIYLSTDDLLSDEDALLEVQVVHSLAIGEQDTTITSVMLPVNLSAGDYFLGAWADYNESVDEEDEANNTITTPLSIGGQEDLVIASFAAPAEAVPGQSIVIANTVKNAGTMTAGSFVTGFYLSADSVLTTSDRLLEVRSINRLEPGAVQADQTEVYIPRSLPSGNYYIGVWADNFGEIEESREDNNTALQPIAVGVSADLQVTDLVLPASLSASETGAAQVNVRNAGVAEAGAFTVGLYLSADALIDANDTKIGAGRLDRLAKNASFTLQIDFQIPAGLADGNYTIGAWADDENTVDEIDEQNNLFSRLVQLGTPLPVDLIVALLQSPDSLRADSLFTLRYRLTNAGTQAAPPFEIGIYLSPDDLINRRDLRLGGKRYTGLGAGQGLSDSLAILLPATVATGAYTIGIWADDASAILETAESNNIAHSEVAVQGKPNQAPVASAGGPYSGAHGSLITFDGTASRDADGDELSYFWEFGDGSTGAGDKISHVYLRDSTYTVILTVTDAAGTADADTTTVSIYNRLPVAEANGPYTANRLEPLQLSSEGTADPDGDILNYNWDFGDLSTGVGPAPKHLYSELDTFTVVFRVQDGHGGTARDSTLVYIYNFPPVALFTPMDVRIDNPAEPVHFDASAAHDPDGYLVRYVWDFGDGSAADSSGPQVDHRFPAPGRYTITLRVRDNDGAVQDTLSALAVAVRMQAGNAPPQQYFLAQNYPNPFRLQAGGATRIRYDVPVPAPVTIKVYNALGQEIAVLVAAAQEPGRYETVWSGRDRSGRKVPAGVYFYVMESGSYRMVRKLAALGREK